MATSKPPYETKTPNPILPLTPTSPFITAYGPKNRVQLVKGERTGRTKQAFKDQCDINFILARFTKTRVVEWLNSAQPQYGDVTGFDFQHAMDLVVKAKQQFMDLPAKIRTQFDNDPAKFLDFVDDPTNVEQMRAMGLMKPRDAAPATPPAPPPSSTAPAGSGEAGAASAKPAKPAGGAA